MSDERWKGVTVENTEVAATIRRYGAPAHTRPSGPGKTVLYYENPEYKGPAAEPFEDQAGLDRGVSKTRVTHTNGPGTETISAVSGTKVSSGKSGNPSVAYRNEFANPSEVLEDAPIENRSDLDDYSEEKAAQQREERDREAAPGGYRPSAVPTAGAASAPVKIDFLERASVEKEESVDDQPSSETEETEETDVEFTASKSLDEGLESKRSSYRSKYPERNYEKLDAMGKADLEALYDQDKDLIGEIKGSGSNGAILRSDLIKALRTDV